MMVDGYLEKMKEYEEIYRKRWGQDVDYTIMPSSMTQEQLLVVMERIIDTGESILVAYVKIFL